MREKIFAEIGKEREAQDREHGGAEHDDGLTQAQWVALLTRHVGLAVCDAAVVANLGRFRRQLVCVAALAVAALESLDRQWRPKDPVTDLRRWGQEMADEEGTTYLLCPPLPKPVSGERGDCHYLVAQEFAQPHEVAGALATLTPTTKETTP